MAFVPDRAGFLDLARRGRLAFVYREVVADTDTPVSAYAKLGRGPYSFLLESVVGGDKWAAYSFAGVRPRAVVRARGTSVEVLQPDGAGFRVSERVEAQEPLRFLDDYLAQLTPAVPPGLPRFFGGAVGWLGYDIVRSFERLPATKPDDLGLPELCFAITDTVVVFDNLRGTVKVVASVDVGGGAAGDPGRAYDDACARIEAVTRLRLGEHGRLNRHLLAMSEALPIADRERMRAFIVERPLSPESTGVWFADAEVHSLADVHATWRARRAFDEKARLALAELGKVELTKTQDDSDGEWTRASVALDLVECGELGADVDVMTQGLTPVSPEDWWSRHPAQPELALRLWMRSAALGVSPGGPTTLLVRRVGVRRAAAIAMEEGELLALRLPTQALRLLSLSLTWYEDAHDVLGAWQLTILLALTRVRAGVRGFPRLALDVERPQLVAVQVALTIVRLEQPHDLFGGGHAFVEWHRRQGLGHPAEL
jgi:hypothetical protein